MTVATMIAAFQTVNASIEGVAAAPDPSAWPLALTPDLLPFVATLPGQATWHSGLGMGKGRKCKRAYHVRVYVEPATQDAAPSATTVLALVEAIGATYRTAASIAGAMVVSVEDQGYLRTYAWGGAQYHGTEFRITVEEPA